ncbi:MAG TPA: D-cysteine desulfhydrase family protein [Acidimicrobiia bacterium]|nr:D-cysteine desulfhydrase family protein [Acidimicrobiia bacterium]
MDAAAPGTRVTIAHVPTPVDDAPRLSEALGVPICVKRDDLTGLALGGNKARKLARLTTDALAQGCDVLVTGGGVQSNHVRQTAAAAAQLGLDAHVVLGGELHPGDPSGNVLLDQLLGASIVRVAADDYYGIERAIDDAAARLRADGRRPYAIPIGGASPEGVLAYVDAAHELRAQRPDVDVVFVADGSGGTHAGLLRGFGADGPQVIGVDVGTRPDLADAVSRMADNMQPEIDGAHVGPGYGALDERTLDALSLAARTEGLVLDPVYTGKAMAALCTWAREGRLAAAASVCFWHTGGQPALFASRYLFAEKWPL